MQTPSSPVNLAWAEAMNAAISSWRAWMNSILPSARLQRAEHAVDAVAGIAEDARARPSRAGARQKKSPTVWLIDGSPRAEVGARAPSSPRVAACDRAGVTQHAGGSLQPGWITILIWTAASGGSGRRGGQRSGGTAAAIRSISASSTATTAKASRMPICISVSRVSSCLRSRNTSSSFTEAIAQIEETSFSFSEP